MGIVVSMLMITVGAIMRFAISAETEGFDVGTAGVVLMIVGLLGAVMSIVFWASWGGFPQRRATVVQSQAAPVATTTRTVVEQRDTI